MDFSEVAKRGFIRTSNGYQSTDPKLILDEIRAFTPEKNLHKEQFDGKYKPNTSYASDRGRIKKDMFP